MVVAGESVEIEIPELKVVSVVSTEQLGSPGAQSGSRVSPGKKGLDRAMAKACDRSRAAARKINESLEGVFIIDCFNRERSRKS